MGTQCRQHKLRALSMQLFDGLKPWVRDPGRCVRLYQ